MSLGNYVILLRLSYIQFRIDASSRNLTYTCKITDGKIKLLMTTVQVDKFMLRGKKLKLKITDKCYSFLS